MKQLLLLLSSLLFIGCGAFSTSIEYYDVDPADYPEIRPYYIINYGAPAYTDTILYNGNMEITRAVWDDGFSVSFYYGNEFDQNFAQIGTEKDIIQPYVDMFNQWGEISSKEFIYDIDGFSVIDAVDGTPLDKEDYRVVDLTYDLIEYHWTIDKDSIPATFTHVVLKYLTTLKDGTKIYGLDSHYSHNGISFEITIN
jgi:hypothetical protein